MILGKNRENGGKSYIGMPVPESHYGDAAGHQGVTFKGTDSGSIMLWTDRFRNGSNRQQIKAEVLSTWELQEHFLDFPQLRNLTRFKWMNLKWEPAWLVIFIAVDYYSQH